MILTVTPNVALDITYAVGELVPGTTHRVKASHARAGGKGVNVARILSALGHDVFATGITGGARDAGSADRLPHGDATGRAVRAELAAQAIPHAFTSCRGETRRTVTITGNGQATVFNEPGPSVGPGDWAGLVDLVAAQLDQAEVLVVAGSLPPGAPDDACAQLARLARLSSKPAIVDTSGRPLLLAAPHATLVKPNAEELTQATGISDPTLAAQRLRQGPPEIRNDQRGMPGRSDGRSRPGQLSRPPGPHEMAQGAKADDATPVQGGPSVVVSHGADGLTALTPGGAWRAWLPEAAIPEAAAGNPTGAGDALVAALAAALATGRGQNASPGHTPDSERTTDPGRTPGSELTPGSGRSENARGPEAATAPAGNVWPEMLTDAVALSAAAVVAPVAGTFDKDVYNRVRSFVMIRSDFTDLDNL